MNMNYTYEMIGNKDLLNSKEKVGFLVPKKIKASEVLPSLDWAIEERKNKNKCLVINTVNALQIDVFELFMKGNSNIILITNNENLEEIKNDINKYKHLLKLNLSIDDAIERGKLLIILVNEDENMNEILVELASELVVSRIDDDLELKELLKKSNKKYKILYKQK